MKIHRTDMDGSLHSRDNLPTKLQLLLSRLLGRELVRPDWADDVDDRLDLLRRASVHERDGLVEEEPLDAVTMTENAFRTAARPENLPKAPQRRNLASLRVPITMAVLPCVFTATMIGLIPDSVLTIAIGVSAMVVNRSIWSDRTRR
ncbi:hypothetical protein [Streptomyces sp. NRRL S-244]|uniref:hypothetical protein n=1 Tax=Streptomyces sp. NRRL S-244 TaxID=1463897 RepID=UPI0004C1E18C|nr:hypothetical protein [Streptomyces sp. NRRL S-244]